ncbi:hypothetical protein [Lapillicoccus jejuensis]|uniref:Secreted protein n=1 Tax=Lapillicoccus jejuensis TaxID=402171 RepID=A0A542DV64_9MICO|nr:hypothetical protein [Lapillicoccus jejuensis]TQJ06991.1 hypothetical protein FB458_0036 [Lapillicoccus jejuensis]
MKPRRLIAPLVALAAVVFTAVPAQAANATSYGFACSASNHWIRQNWPNIRTDYSTAQNVWFDTDLYRWNGSQWAFWQSSGWMGGASTSSGRRALGYLAGSPYYFLYGTTRNVAPLLGWTFTQLPSGYYRTVEFYSTPSGSWSTWSHVQGASDAHCQI